MITMRPAAERGHANHGWLDANFTFSFANYYDPAWMGFRALRVINDDIVAPGRGFGKHPHDNMEILTYMISGSLGHNDSTGGSGAITPGELQHMSAGTGIFHSEQNASQTEESHSLQIWIQPNRRNVKPVYNQRRFRVAEEPNKFHLLASGGDTAGRDDSFAMYADADLYAAVIEPGATVTHAFGKPYGWLHVVRGEVTLAGARLKAGDGVALSNEEAITLTTPTGGEVLLFDLD
ncbi:MAG TPA: pirin family protein [Acidobacteriaceae bacterium]|nr:pirin family protein [Acidobacteriaceae bacterium]